MPLFGEIVEPVSRALYIDESSDDEDPQDESTSKIVEIEWQNEAPASFETLLIFHGQLASDFLLKILQGTNSKSAPHLKDKLVHRARNSSSKELTICVYRIANGIFGCLCPSVDIIHSNDMLNKLVPVFNTCKQLIVLATAPAPFYKGNDPTLDLPPAFMRMLYSSAFESKNAIAPLLEPPNMVTGIPASVLNWCEVFKKAGCLYVCYSDSDYLDSISAEPLIRIFSNVFEGVFEPKVLSFQSAIHEPNSNLYM